MWRSKVENIWSFFWLTVCFGGVIYGLGDIWIKWDTAVGALVCGVLGALATLGFFLALRRSVRKRNTPLRAETHPLLGVVKFYKDRWEAQPAGQTWDFWGNLDPSGQICAGETALAQEIVTRLPDLLEEARSSLLLFDRELLKAKSKLHVEDIVFEAVQITDKTAFTLLFKVPKYPEGAYVDYENFTLEDYGAVH